VDHDRSVETTLDLDIAGNVRVVPEQAGVLDDELVVVATTRRDDHLRDRRTIRVVGHAQPVPVNRGVLGQPIFEVDDHAIAELGLEHRTRDGCDGLFGRGVAERPDVRGLAGEVLVGRRLGHQLDLDDVGRWIGVDERDGLRRRAGTEIRLTTGHRTERRHAHDEPTQTHGS
jgi:hypothetical protein